MTSATILSALISNIIVAAAIACIAIAIGKCFKRPALLHAVWLIVLVKLVTPPIFQLPVYSVTHQTRTVAIDNEVIRNAEELVVAEEKDSVHHGHFEFNFLPPEFSFNMDEYSDHSETIYENSNENEVADGPLETDQVSDGSTAEYDSIVATPPMRIGGESRIDPNLSYDENQNGLIAGSHFKQSKTDFPVGPTTLDSLLTYSPTVVCGIWLLLSVVWIVNFIRRQRRFHKTIQLASENNSHDQKQLLQIQARLERISNQLGLKQPPELILAPGKFVPLVWATFKKTTLVLPRKLIRNFSSSQLDSLIAHEVAHLVCRHHLIRWFEIGVTAFFWWCPVLWIARRKLREAEEEICDACVVAAMPEHAADYAQTLLDTADYLSQFSPKPSMDLPSTAMGMNHFEFLKRRITMIMHGQTKPRLSLTGWLVLIAILAFGLPFSPTLATASLATTGTQERTHDDDHGKKHKQDHDRKHRHDRDDRDHKHDIDEDDVKEIVREIKEEMGELDEHLKEMIQEAREGISEHLDDVPPKVKKMIAELDIEKIVDDATKEIPKVVKMFVDEIDFDKLMKEVSKAVDDGEWKGEIDKQELEKLKKDIKVQIKNKVDRISSALKKDMGKVRIEVKDQFDQLPEKVKQALKTLDVDLKFAEGKSDIAKQYLKDLQIEKIIKSALDQEEDKRRKSDHWQERRRERSERDQERRVRERRRVQENREREREHDSGNVQEKLKRALQQAAAERDRAQQVMREMERALKMARQREEKLMQQLKALEAKFRTNTENRIRSGEKRIRVEESRLRGKEREMKDRKEVLERELRNHERSIEDRFRDQDRKKRVEIRKRNVERKKSDARPNVDVEIRERRVEGDDRLRRLERSMEAMMRQMQQMQKQMKEMGRNRRGGGDRE